MEMDNSIHILLGAYQDEIARLSNDIIMLKAQIILLQGKEDKEDKEDKENED